MGLPRLKRCCCCCSLEVGSKIIALWQLISGIVVLIMGILAEPSDKPINSTNEANSPIGQMVGGISSALFGVLLLIGICKSSTTYINVWVIVNIIGVIVYIAFSVGFAVIFFIGGLAPIGLVLIIQCIIILPFQLYLLTVVSSYRKDLQTGIITP